MNDDVIKVKKSLIIFYLKIKKTIEEKVSNNKMIIKRIMI